MNNAADSTGPVLVIDGYGISLTVHHGHLTIKDGIGTTRRERRLTRAQRTVKRILILAETGTITLDAIAWCTDVGIAITQLDHDRTPRMHTVPREIDDARIRRAQAAAPSGPVGLAIAHALLGAKLVGQATVCEQHLDKPKVASRIRSLAEQLAETSDLRAARSVESDASNAYFAAWTTQVAAKFAARDLAKIPEQWTAYISRKSPTHLGGKSPRKAADPVNAMLNYAYTLAETECVLACHALGLDPGLGIVHTDKRDRDSLALDLIEPLRPIVDAEILQLLEVRYFMARDFHETRDGSCRLMPSVTHKLASGLADYARAVGPYAEHVAHTLAHSTPGDVALRTPLSRNNHRLSRVSLVPIKLSPMPPSKEATRTCRDCGDPVPHSKRLLCDACWNVTRRDLATARAAAGAAALETQRTRGKDPTNTAEASARRQASLVSQRAARDAWDDRHPDVIRDPRHFQREILPRLKAVSLGRITAATGLSVSAASRIRSGGLVPHARHWAALGRLGDLGKTT